MKKLVLPFFSCLLVFTLLLGSFGSVKAAAGGNPWVTPVSGDMVFTTEIVSVSALPGTFVLANQLLAPKGFPAGEAQFGGNGVRVTGFDAGKATLCFSLSAIEVSQGWGGKVGVWNGSAWVLLSTTIAPVAAEASTTSACATITGNGTYAFIKWIADAEKLPNSNGECKFDVWLYDFPHTDGGTGEGYDFYWIDGVVFYSETDLSGLPVSVRLLGTIPENTIEMIGTGVGTLSTYSTYGPDFYGAVFDDSLWWGEVDPNPTWESIAFYVTFGNCYKVIDWMDGAVY